MGVALKGGYGKALAVGPVNLNFQGGVFQGQERAALRLARKNGNGKFFAGAADLALGKNKRARSVRRKRAG